MSDTMYCWGNTVNGELGLGGIEEDHVLTPRESTFSEVENVVHVACGDNHSVFVTKRGEVYSCGSNDFGQLGHDKPRKRPELVDALEAYNILRPACGATHSLAVNNWGQLFSWGSDLQGQLGHNLNHEVLSIPKVVKALATKHVVQMACGQYHCLALTNDGKLYTWGSNEFGQLGLGTMVKGERLPTLVNSLLGIPIAFIACGASHSFAVSKSGAVYGWGKNSFGQLGVNDAANKLFPTQLKSMRSLRVMYISCGDDHSVFLTLDGGVFSCGAGMYGQLGHGIFSNEMLPRKVLELMGSTVTQIACGKRHTLALVASRGRVYGFGLGASGQIGRRNPQNASTPQVVLGPWVFPSGRSSIDLTSVPPDNCRVKRIFTGGDHAFACVTRQQNFWGPDDFREHPLDTQIVFLSPEKTAEFLNIGEDDTLDQDLMSYVETVFSSQACINASFLKPGEEHFCCTSRNSGIDMENAELSFQIISRIENLVLLELISSCFIRELIPSLSSSPPDVETLRVYVIMPLYHQFENPKNHNLLQVPFGKALNNLKEVPGNIVGLWWLRTPVDYFERLIRIYKEVIIHLLIQPQSNSIIEAGVRLQGMKTSLELLSRLNKLNHQGGLRVPYDSFYIHELQDKVDIRVDYVKWITTEMPSQPGQFYFCNYPFLFDAPAKTLLLQTDQALQMQSAMNDAATRALTQALFSPMASTNISQFLILIVSRENIVQDTINNLGQAGTQDLKKPLKVKFIGEEAEDAGGVRKEFFLLLIREIVDLKFGMFKQYDEERVLWFSQESFEDEVMFFLVGLLCGLAIYNFTIIDLPFPLALYKKLLQEPVGLEDLKGLSPTLARNLQHLLDYEGDDLEDVFLLRFEISQETYGEVKVHPLKPGGESISVTQHNKKEYVDLYVDFILNKSVDKHFTPFYKGFHKVCGGRVLELFHSHELMDLVTGNENYDWEELERNADYKNGYDANHPTIKLFWEVFYELTLEQKKQFLLFLTGCDRIPILGMKAIKITFQPTPEDKYLPVAHTCFNLLDLPKYSTKERLRYKLVQAIQHNQGFSLQ